MIYNIRMNNIKYLTVILIILAMLPLTKTYTQQKAMSFSGDTTPTHATIYIQPTKAQEPFRRQEGCDTWYNSIDQMSATQIEKNWLKQIIFCESTCNSQALNPYGFKGLMQFDNITWNENCSGDIWSGYNQLECAINLYRKGQQWRWQCSAL